MGSRGHVRANDLGRLAGVCALIGAVMGPAVAAHAQDRLSITACRFEVFGSGNVAKVGDGRSFVLADGRQIRIAAIEAPPAPDPGETGPRAAAGSAAKAALESILAGQTISLQRQGPDAIDRYGRIVAHVEVAGLARPVGPEMVARGHARVAAMVGHTACAAELLALERTARSSKLGLWGEPYYVVRAAENGAELLAERGHFTVVEGRVWSVRESGGTIYLNFGRRWSQALTVTISKRHERIFAGAGLSPKGLEHRIVRVRGWIDVRNGPRIEASRPEQIEMAELN
jgi:endonuclease YncB( thermonuclease family)